MARLMLAAFIASAVLLTGSPVLADGIGILPTTIQIDAAQSIATVTIVNNDSTLHANDVRLGIDQGAPIEVVAHRAS